MLFFSLSFVFLSLFFSREILSELPQAADNQNNRHQNIVDDGAAMVYTNNGSNDAAAAQNVGRRDPAVQGVIDRLNTAPVPIAEIMSLPAIAEVERNNKEATPTIALPNREPIVEAAYQQAMAQGSFDGKDYNGPVRQEHRMDIVLGLPGSGKSSVYTERISQEQGARVIDTDDYREFVPEYNGQNAPVVHEEASSIKKRVMNKALANGDNIILSTIGNNAQKLEREIKSYNNKGYAVYIHLNELPNHKSQARALGRFFKDDGTTGRYVSPKLIANYGDSPTQTYLYLLGRSGANAEAELGRNQADRNGSLQRGVQGVRVRRGVNTEDARSNGQTTPQGARIAGYDRYNNDVNFGQPPMLVESSEQTVSPEYAVALEAEQQYREGFNEGVGTPRSGFGSVRERSPEMAAWYRMADGEGENGYHPLTENRLDTLQASQLAQGSNGGDGLGAADAGFAPQFTLEVEAQYAEIDFAG